MADIRLKKITVDNSSHNTSNSLLVSGGVIVTQGGVSVSGDISGVNVSASNTVYIGSQSKMSDNLLQVSQILTLNSIGSLVSTGSATFVLGGAMNVSTANFNTNAQRLTLGNVFVDNGLLSINAVSGNTANSVLTIHKTGAQNNDLVVTNTAGDNVLSIGVSDTLASTRVSSNTFEFKLTNPTTNVTSGIGMSDTMCNIWSPLVRCESIHVVGGISTGSVHCTSGYAAQLTVGSALLTFVTANSMFVSNANVLNSTISNANFIGVSTESLTASTGTLRSICVIDSCTLGKLWVNTTSTMQSVDMTNLYTGTCTVNSISVISSANLNNVFANSATIPNVLASTANVLNSTIGQLTVPGTISCNSLVTNYANTLAFTTGSAVCENAATIGSGIQLGGGVKSNLGFELNVSGGSVFTVNTGTLGTSVTSSSLDVYRVIQVNDTLVCASSSNISFPYASTFGLNGYSITSGAASCSLHLGSADIMINTSGSLNLCNIVLSSQGNLNTPASSHTLGNVLISQFGTSIGSGLNTPTITVSNLIATSSTLGNVQLQKLLCVAGSSTTSGSTFGSIVSKVSNTGGDVLIVNDSFDTTRWKLSLDQSNYALKVNRYSQSGVFLDSVVTVTTTGNVSLGYTSVTGILDTGDATVGGLCVTSSGSVAGVFNISSTSGSALCVSGGGAFLGDLILSKSLVIGGNLTVNGTISSVNTTNTVVKDNILLLNSGPNGTHDSGIVFQRYQTDNDSGSGDVVADTTFVSEYTTQSNWNDICSNKVVDKCQRQRQRVHRLVDKGKLWAVEWSNKKGHWLHRELENCDCIDELDDAESICFGHCQIVQQGECRLWIQ